MSLCVPRFVLTPVTPALLLPPSQKCQYLLLRLGSADAERTPSSNTSQGVSVSRRCSSARARSVSFLSASPPQAPKWFDVAAKKLQGTEFQTVGDFVSDLQLLLNQVRADWQTFSEEVNAAVTHTLICCRTSDVLRSRNYLRENLRKSFKSALRGNVSQKSVHQLNVGPFTVCRAQSNIEALLMVSIDPWSS